MSKLNAIYLLQWIIFFPIEKLDGSIILLVSYGRPTNTLAISRYEWVHCLLNPIFYRGGLSLSLKFKIGSTCWKTSRAGFDCQSFAVTVCRATIRTVFTPQPLPVCWLKNFEHFYKELTHDVSASHQRERGSFTADVFYWKRSKDNRAVSTFWGVGRDSRQFSTNFLF